MRQVFQAQMGSCAAWEAGRGLTNRAGKVIFRAIDAGPSVSRPYQSVCQPAELAVTVADAYQVTSVVLAGHTSSQVWYVPCQHALVRLHTLPVAEPRPCTLPC